LAYPVSVNMTAAQLRAIFEAASGVREDEDASKAKTRRRILDAAAARFERFGYRKTSMEDVAREAGVAKGTVYLYYSSKKDLLVACSAEEKKAMMPGLIAVLDAPPADRLRLYVRTIFRWATHAPLSTAMVRRDQDMAAIVDDIGEDAIAGQRAMARAFLTSILTEADLSVTPDEERRLHAAISAMAAMQAFGVPPHLRDEIEPDELADELADLITHGVVARSRR
jgi:AcrR family transcriptional regulator